VQILAQRLEIGMPWVSLLATPSADMSFGGLEASRFGSEGEPEAMQPYFITKSGSIQSI
jgi:acyl-CoA reductase-like NAD-dependent aldehyde dehydrogenase